MTPSRRGLLQGAAALAASLPAAAASPGPFQPSWDSLAAHYSVPDWFRDAKFGIWAHWGPQCMPERGDWYGRLMYVQGEPAYADHLARFGPPSQTGFLDLLDRWKGEAWDPDALVGLYRCAGARYFVALANHHDNFDTFESTHQPWNATRIGPKRDLIGGWARAARRHGLRFGVSNHGAHAWHWWQTAYGYDAEGPMAGARYDAFRLTRADGAGRFWEGLDPQDLYTGPHMVAPDGLTSIKAMNAWHDAHDGRWLETPPPGDARFVARWLARCNELTDKYKPDYVYFDDTGLPLGQAGLAAVARYYNADRARHGGASQVVVTGKKLSELQRRGVVEDLERGYSDTLRPDPWQTCTCIGNWHYDRELYDRKGYKSAKSVVQRLADVVSKNGNLLLSIPVRSNGTIDALEQGIVAEITAWNAVHGEAIFDSRPWAIYGEGPTRTAGGTFGESEVKGFTDQDIRFTTRAGALYAIVLEQPEKAVTIRALARGAPHAPGEIERVELVGAEGPLAFERTDQDLTVQLNRARPTDFTPVLRIRGRGLVPGARAG
jgi:alpha-L-fucosidase